MRFLYTSMQKSKHLLQQTWPMIFLLLTVQLLGFQYIHFSLRVSWTRPGLSWRRVLCSMVTVNSSKHWDTRIYSRTKRARARVCVWGGVHTRTYGRHRRCLRTLTSVSGAPQTWDCNIQYFNKNTVINGRQDGPTYLPLSRNVTMTSVFVVLMDHSQ
jgi:hypothetical protein